MFIYFCLTSAECSGHNNYDTHPLRSPSYELTSGAKQSPIFINFDEDGTVCTISKQEYGEWALAPDGSRLKWYLKSKNGHVHQYTAEVSHHFR